MFFWEFYEIYKTTLFQRTPLVAASVFLPWLKCLRSKFNFVLAKKSFCIGSKVWKCQFKIFFYRLYAKKKLSQSFFRSHIHLHFTTCGRISLFFPEYDFLNDFFFSSFFIVFFNSHYHFGSRKIPHGKILPLKIPIQKISTWNIPTHFINCVSSLFLHLILRP